MTRQAVQVLALCLTVAACQSAGQQLTYRDADPTLTGTLCKPEGTGPFPVVVYNNGGLGTIIGGAPEETCAALAAAGFVGFSPIRRQTRPLRGHLDDVLAAIDTVKALKFADRNRIGLIGFSRGAMLAYQAAVLRREFKAVVIMAVAVNRGVRLEDASLVSAPVLLLVSEGDTGSRETQGRNTLEGMQKLSAALRAAGKDSRLIIYPDSGGEGHTLFFSVGKYWPDVVNFLRQHL